MTKKDLAERIGVTPAAVGQYETGMTRPRPDLVPRLADALGVPPAFFLLGRPHGKLDGSMAHFRSLRSTRAHQRAKAAAFVEQVWELAHALERQVRLPHVALPGFSGGEVHSGVELPGDPAQAARALRRLWGWAPARCRTSSGTWRPTGSSWSSRRPTRTPPRWTPSPPPSCPARSWC